MSAVSEYIELLKTKPSLPEEKKDADLDASPDAVTDYLELVSRNFRQEH